MDTYGTAPDVQNIAVQDERLGWFNLVIPNLNRPIWHGKHLFGKTSLYYPAFSNAPTIPCFAIVAVLSDQAYPEMNTVIYAMYTQDTDINSACEHMLSTIKNTVAELLVRIKDEQRLALH